MNTFTKIPERVDIGGIQPSETGHILEVAKPAVKFTVIYPETLPNKYLGKVFQFVARKRQEEQVRIAAAVRVRVENEARARFGMD